MNYRGSTDTEDLDRVVAAVRNLEQNIRPGSDQLTCIIAQQYVRALAPKDEFEIGRLHSAEEFAREIEEAFGADAKVSYLMAPPLLGDKKRKFGPWMSKILAVLGKARWVRGTWVDVFRFSTEAQLSKQALEACEDWIDHILAHTHAGNFVLAVELAALFAEVRGFGHVKARHLENAKKKGDVLKSKLVQAPPGASCDASYDAAFNIVA